MKMKPPTQFVASARTPRDPALTENDRIIEIAELTKFKTRLEWLGDPKNVFRYSVRANGEVEVGDRFNFKVYPNLSAAIDAQQK